MQSYLFELDGEMKKMQLNVFGKFSTTFMKVKLSQNASYNPSLSPRPKSFQGQRSPIMTNMKKEGTYRE